MTASWQKSYDKPRPCVEKQRHHSANKDLYSQGYGLPSSHVWAVKKAEHERIDAYKLVLQKTPESPLAARRSNWPILKGNQLWILIGGTDAEAEALVFWSPDANSQLIGKVPDAGKNWGQKEKRVSEDEMAGWHHRCKGHELEQTLGDDEEHRLSVLQSMGSQKVRCYCETEQQQLGILAENRSSNGPQWLV